MKPSHQLRLILTGVILTAVIFDISCKSNSNNTAASDSTRKVYSDTAIKDADSAMKFDAAVKADTGHKPRTRIKTGITPDTAKYGILGYVYPSSMIVNTSKNITAYISVKYPSSKVKDTLLKMVIQDDGADKGDSVSVTEPIRLYKYVTLSLTSTDSSLQVINFPQIPARQLLDTINGNKWTWSILAKSADHPISKLKLIMSTEDPLNYETRTIPILIKVDPFFIRKIYDFLISDPKVLVVSIIIPLVTFFGGMLFAKRKKKKSNS